MEDDVYQDRDQRPRRRLEPKFEARTQRENESLDDYADYFDNYCSALDIEEADKVKFFLAFLNTQSRRRAKIIKERLQNWNDILKILLRRGSVEEQRIARRKLEQKTLQPNEDVIDFATSCFDLAQKAWPTNNEGAETFAIDYFIRGLPDPLADRAELRDSDDIWKLAEFVADQAEKLRCRGVLNRKSLKQQESIPSNLRQLRDGYTSGITCDLCGQLGHLCHQCRRNSDNYSRKQSYQNTTTFHRDSLNSKSYPHYRDCQSIVDVERRDSADSNNNSHECMNYDDIHYKSWDSMTDEEHQCIIDNITTSKLYIQNKLQCDPSIDGYVVRKLLLKPQLVSQTNRIFSTVPY